MATFLWTGCGNKSNPIVISKDTSKEVNTEVVIEREEIPEIEHSGDLSSIFGFPVLLPENEHWIKNVEYKQTDANHLEVFYYDDFLGGNCKLSVGKNPMTFKHNNLYDELSEEIWMGNTTSGQMIYVKVQHFTDDNIILATWEYQNYSFSIQGSVAGDMTDTNVIPKTALFIISNFE